MNKKERLLVEEIYRDCLMLRRRGELTEFGKGQTYLCRMLLRKNKSNDVLDIIKQTEVTK